MNSLISDQPLSSSSHPSQQKTTRVVPTYWWCLNGPCCFQTPRGEVVGASPPGNLCKSQISWNFFQEALLAFLPGERLPKTKIKFHRGEEQPRLCLCCMNVQPHLMVTSMVQRPMCPTTLGAGDSVVTKSNHVHPLLRNRPPNPHPPSGSHHTQSKSQDPPNGPARPRVVSSATWPASHRHLLAGE